jgi:hypothetical protein
MQAAVGKSDEDPFQFRRTGACHSRHHAQVTVSRDYCERSGPTGR